jgi:protein XagA
MKNIIFKFALFFTLISMTPSVLKAQAWTKSKGTGFYKLDFTRIKANSVFDTKGEIVNFRTLGNYTTSFYGEYGISNKLTVIGYVPFFVRNVVNETKGIQTGKILEPSIVNNNFGDVDLGFRYALSTKGVAISANLLLGIPTGDAKQIDGLFTGDGEFNQMLKIAAGTGSKRWWTQAAIGVNNRTKGFSDELRYDFEFGYKFFDDRLLAIIKLNGIESLENGNVSAVNTGLFSNNVEFLGFGPEILYFANAKKTIGISARLAGSLKGQNVLTGPSMSFGVFSQF